MRKPKEPVKATSVWFCDTCKTGEMEHAAMMTHLKDAHGLDVKGLKCHKKMIMHLDSADSYISTYEVTIPSVPNLVLTNATCSPRQKGDWMNEESR